jgi:hypothetical protein
MPAGVVHSQVHRAKLLFGGGPYVRHGVGHGHIAATWP